MWKAILFGVLAIAAIVFAYNWITRQDLTLFVTKLDRQLTAADQDLLATEKQQTELASAIQSAVVSLLQRQRLYEGKMAAESDDKRKAMWGNYRLAFFLNRHEILKIGTRLDDLRSVTTQFRKTVIGGLKSVQQAVAQGVEKPAKQRTKADLPVARAKISELEPVIMLAIQLVAEAKNDIATDKVSLKDQQRKLQALVPAGADPAHEFTKEVMGALDAGLKENEKAQNFLDRFDQSVSSFGKAVFSTKDILKSQDEFLRGLHGSLSSFETEASRQIAVANY